MVIHPPTHWISKVKIRPLSQADLSALEWGGEYAHFRRLYAEIFQSARRGRAILWVADLEGSGVIGQLFVQITSARAELADGVRRAYIYGFRVKPPYRSAGVGTLLMDVAESDLAHKGFRWVTLNVGRDNPAARRLYEKRGYQVVAAEPGQWAYRDEQGRRHEVNEPAWRMEKHIGGNNYVNK